MILILIAIVCCIVAGVCLLIWGGLGYKTRHMFSMLCGLILLSLGGITSIGYAFSVFDWLGAEQKANILNREYGTNYTQSEVFWASDVIDTVRQLDRKRIEVNGDIMRDKE